MELTRKAIKEHLNDHDWLLELEEYFSIIDEKIETSPDIAIEACKSLLEAIAKNILFRLSATYKDDTSIKLPTLFNNATQSLCEKNDETEKDFVKRINQLIHFIGEIRNDRGIICHGRVLPLEAKSTIALAKSIKSITDGIASYYIEHFCVIDLEYKDLIEYEDNEEFNNYLDEENPIENSKILYSKALYDYDYDAYYQELLDYQNEKQAESDTVEFESITTKIHTSELDIANKLEANIIIEKAKEHKEPVMTIQSEAELEQALIEKLQQGGYEYIPIRTEQQMLANLRKQLEIHNKLEAKPFTDNEFQQILTHLKKENTVFSRAEVLRGRYELYRDTGELTYITFLNTHDWCLNEFQIANQVSTTTRKARFDVTILLNGLPLVQIELKKAGIAIKEAFNQIKKYYRRHDFWSGTGLYGFVQLFIISNKVNTKYFAHNAKQPFEQTFVWTNELNEHISNLFDFADTFLKPCHLSKMITHYTVLHQSDKCLMILRPYQYYACEAIIKQVKETNNFAYIWHTTGSGKTLTSFKASQVITGMPTVEKVLFVVDRRDLDYKTAKEFNEYSPNSVDMTDNTHKLVNQLTDNNTKLIVTTIQKLRNAITHPRYLEEVSYLQDKKVVFIFDECHRSQFGLTHKKIKEFFKGAQMFGFTGTPIFRDNANTSQGIKQTTKDLFGECLHKYVIVDAIRDENVLRFAVEYIGKYSRKNTVNELDIPTEENDEQPIEQTKEVLENPARLTKIVDYILRIHDQKTQQRAFTALFATSSIDCVIKYYELFKERQQLLIEEYEAKGLRYKPLTIATVFSYTQNEEEKNLEQVNGLLDEEPLEVTGKINKTYKDKLDSFIADYNQLFNTKFAANDTQSFTNYYNDIAERIKSTELDLLLVVNMFLTGFDSKQLNTLYVDKNLKQHGLIQAFSRTNRILDANKTQGNIVCFRNLKKATDDAITLFSNKDAIETVLVDSYENYLAKYNTLVTKLLALVPTVESVDKLPDENAELNFVEIFRDMLRLKKVLSSFADFKVEDLSLSEQTFADYTSKYLDIYEKVKKTIEDPDTPASPLAEIDFETVLIHKDIINVAYIIELLQKIAKTKDQPTRQEQTDNIISMLAGEVSFRDKRGLIERFIKEQIPYLTEEQIPEAFKEYWQTEQEKALITICTEEQLDEQKVRQLIENYKLFDRFPRTHEIKACLDYTPKILERKAISDRICKRVSDFFDVFFKGMD
ncbi:type I restriction endonuclease subunit R [Entomomonas asaccharolytica]|uniref:Type I restriction enzyme endonuclease subunit n=1 Tax=Entomomonas asaccharolytica TaxID=2785331 RepID=A0A974RWT5_9GAMM|nr:type I restriction endonuclease subunit R [Entomomonas asaccharolytica]QQP85533.1 type I restriction endonuclease subunit R [Entomomonas asaccharolytica]